jgi:two-component system, NtrC family, response regulator
MKERGGTLDVTLKSIDIGVDDFFLLKELRLGRYVELTVSDSGCGIPKRLIEKIFDPFFTTKVKGEGTGMGLSLVYGIIKDMQGKISVFSEPDMGTSFQVLIPEQSSGMVKESSTPAEEPVKGWGRVLIVDDEPSIIEWTFQVLSKLGYEAVGVGNGMDALDMFKENPLEFDLVLLDLELPDGNGLDLLPEFTQSHGAPEVIIITGTGDARGAELAFKYGAWDYVQKPFLLDEVFLPIARALQYRKEKLASPCLVPLIRPAIIGESSVIRKCLEEVGKAAATDASVLIIGETGTGKELFAKAIHQNSKRSGEPFIAVDCGALPETLLESTLFGHEKGSFTGAGKKQDGLLVQANKGTLMLDEVGDLPLAAQKSFLRTLQERSVRPIGGSREIPVDIRLVAATNLDLDQMVRENLFRQDLLYRIRAMEIKLPSLRERHEDIEDIVVKKLHGFANRYQIETKAISPEFLKVLSKHNWPGNVRELFNVLEYVLASAGSDPTLFPKHLPPEYRMSELTFKPAGQKQFKSSAIGIEREKELPLLNDYRLRLEKDYLKELINRSNRDRKAACQMSGISQSRLYGLLNKHGLPGFGLF